MNIHNLVESSEYFRHKKFQKYEHKFQELVRDGQNPKTLFIGCSDSRVLPNLITGTGPGDLFIVRNIGNFVAPYNPDEDFHSTAAAIEYAVSVLEVSDIIVSGHSHCGAIEGMYKIDKMGAQMIHVKKWLELGEEAKHFVEENAPKDISYREKLEMTEKLSVIYQLDHLLSYPEVARKVNNGELFLHGWYYALESGKIEYYDAEQEEFIEIT